MGWNFSQASLKKVARTSPPCSSRRSMLKRVPSPRALLQRFTSDLLVTRALIVHRFWYGFRSPIGTNDVATACRTTGGAAAR